MAITDRPFTGGEIKAALQTSYTSMFSGIELILPRETYLEVDYEAVSDRIGITNAREFFYRRYPSPSDCTWMVPGTVRRW